MNFEQWRNDARVLLTAGVAPGDIEWADTETLRHTAAADSAAADASGDRQGHARPPHISASLLRLLECISVHRHAGRWDLMYRLTWRATTENPRLLDDAADPDVHNATLMQKAVDRDVHKMHAFVRFREISDAAGTAYFAWFEPEHGILRRGAAFFVKRFPNMRWTLATPQGAAIWAGELRFIDAPDAASLRVANRGGDDYEALWRTYYRSICNVARVNPSAMQREMPQRYWKHLPEAVEIQRLIRDGLEEFSKRQRESPNEGIIMPKAIKRSLPPPPASAESPATCRRCDLWQHATQAVEGEGAPRARLMLVGEQPGDEEDLRGHPFVGPAGKVLDQAITAAGLERKDLFVTNAVKHFKWEPRGKRRLHKKPGSGEINACSIWLEHEIAVVKPVAIVALGATALRALTGSTLAIAGARLQELRHPGGAWLIATYHPSAILRAEDQADVLRGHLENDLRQAARIAARATPLESADGP